MSRRGKGAEVKTGPRGGKYTTSANGNKIYKRPNRKIRVVAHQGDIIGDSLPLIIKRNSKKGKAVDVLAREELGYKRARAPHDLVKVGSKLPRKKALAEKQGNENPFAAYDDRNHKNRDNYYEWAVANQNNAQALSNIKYDLKKAGKLKIRSEKVYST